MPRAVRSLASVLELRAEVLHGLLELVQDVFPFAFVLLLVLLQC